MSPLETHRVMRARRAEDLIGRKLSHYEIVDEISRGGMGVVYRALDVNLGREVAF